MPELAARIPASRIPQRLGRATLLLFCLAILLTHSAFALDPKKKLHQYAHQAWTLGTGLPGDLVTAITQTTDGYLWVGTSEGLARFDGAHFEIFDKASGQLPSDYIFCLLADLDGALWIGTNGGLARYRMGKFETFGSETGLGDARVLGMSLDRSGSIWIATIARLYSYRQGAFTSFEPPHDSGVYRPLVDVKVDQEDTVWVFLKGGLVCRFRDGQFQAAPELAELRGRDLWAPSVDREGAVWVSDNNHVFRYSRGQLTTFGPTEGLVGVPASRAVQDREGNIWVGTSSGLGRILDGKCQLFQSKGREMPKHTTEIYEDREGNLWVGTEGQGLHRFADGSFTPFGSEDGLPESLVYALSEDFDGNIWVATDEGLHRGRDSFVRVDAGEQRFSGNFAVFQVLPDPRDRSLWVATASGLFHWRDESLTHYTTKDGLPNDTILSLCLDSQGTLWIGSVSGAACFKEGRFFIPEAFTDVVNVGSIAEDRAGGIWLGTSIGPMRYSNGQLTRFGRQDGLVALACVGMHIDSEGTVWIATQNGGLSRYSGDRFFTYLQRDGLPKDLISAIAEDPSGGHLWLGSKKGVFQVDKQQLEDFRRAESSGSFRSLSGPQMV
jgi:ligand-binding sensor domain-containing protein